METNFIKTTSRKVAFLGVALFAGMSLQAQVATSFAGNYSNEGDVTAKGILSFQMTQTGAKLEGTASYQAFDDSVSSGILSVNGYVKNGIGYIRFRDSNANIVADGALHYEKKNVVFRQTTLSDFMPHYAVLYR